MTDELSTESLDLSGLEGAQDECQIPTSQERTVIQVRTGIVQNGDGLLGI